MKRRWQLPNWLAAVGVLTVVAQQTKPFPAHWGPPPAVETRDYRPLPGGYGQGSSTMAHWIEANLAKDAAAGGTNAAAKPLYSQSLDALPDGTPPDEFMVLAGDFLVKHEGTNGFLELPGAPVESFAVQFGPAEKENVSVSADVFGTNRGRRQPTFGVGLGGLSGWKLQVSPAKKAMELIRDQESKVTQEFEWQGGSWTRLHLQVRQAKEGEWQIEGKAWVKGQPEPADWQIRFTETEAPISGRASIFGSPFAGTPIQFDELRVARVP